MTSPLPGARRPLAATLIAGVLVAVLAGALGAIPLQRADAHAAAPTRGEATSAKRIDRLSTDDGRTLRTPSRTADFPRLPKSCYTADGSLSNRPCRLRTYDGHRPTVVLWGDSHSWEYVPAVRQLATRHRVNLILLLHGACPPALRLPADSGDPTMSCDRANDRYRAFVDRLRHRRGDLSIILSAFWSGYREDYRRMQAEAAGGPASGVDGFHQHMARLAVEASPGLFAWLGRRHLTVDVVGQSGTVPADPPECAAGREPYQCDLPRVDVLPRATSNRRWLRERMRDLDGRPMLIDPSPAYCGDVTCLAHVGGTNTWYDDLHLAAGLTQQLAGYFEPVYARLRRRS